VAAGDYVAALAFSPDGRRLAVSSQADARIGEGVAVWDLDPGRGTQTLRGLAGRVSRVCLSADGRLLAALAHDWQVAVWDLADGRLLRVLDTPRGFVADNAALAFDPAGRQLAFCTGRQAVLWDIATGAELRRWDLPPGLVDVLAFPAADRLLLFRTETRDGMPPLSDFPPDDHPRVCRLRNLLAADPGPIRELGDFNRGVHCAAAPADGRYFVVEGQSGNAANRRQAILALDGTTGAVCWTKELPVVTSWAWELLDPQGELAALRTCEDPANEVALIRLASGQTVDFVPGSPFCVGPGARQLIRSGPARPGMTHPGFALLPRHGATPLVVLGIDSDPSSPCCFDHGGDLFIWGNGDGTVTVCHLEAVRTRLAVVGLGW
jgi:WD40 repeat protein